MSSYTEILFKAQGKPYQGKGKRIGTPGNYRYIYPKGGSKSAKDTGSQEPESKEPKAETHLLGKIFAGLKKLWKRGDKPTDNARAALEGMAQDDKVVAAIRESKDESSLKHLEEMLVAHGAEIKELKAEVSRLRRQGPAQQQQQQQQQQKPKSLLAMLLEAVRETLAILSGKGRTVKLKDEDEDEKPDEKPEEKPDEKPDEKKPKKPKKSKKVKKGYSDLLNRG